MFDLNVAIAKQLKEFRAEFGLPQKELARLFGITPTTLARWEQGAAPVGNPNIVRLALYELGGQLSHPYRRLLENPNIFTIRLVQQPTLVDELEGIYHSAWPQRSWNENLVSVRIAVRDMARFVYRVSELAMNSHWTLENIEGWVVAEIQYVTRRPASLRLYHELARAGFSVVPESITPQSTTPPFDFLWTTFRDAIEEEKKQGLIIPLAAYTPSRLLANSPPALSTEH